MPQYAIVKDKTKYQIASDYIASISSGTNKLYFFYGNPVTWSTGESTPPTPTDTPLVERQIWDGIIGLKRITTTDVKPAIRRINWTSGQYYDMYREDYDGATVTGVSLAGEYTNTKPLSLARSNNVVLVDDAGTYKIYRCIDNRSTTTGNPIASTTKPTFTTSGVQTLADGYKWKYLTTLTSTEVNDYMTTLHVPIKTTASNVTLSGGVSAIVMTNRGAGYTSTPTVTIRGDGAGLTLGTPVLSGGSVVYIPVTASGSGYTSVTIEISGGGTPTVAATARAVLAPDNGFGYDNLKETEPNFALINCININTDAVFPTRGVAPTVYSTSGVLGLKYRTVGLIENPYNYGTTTVSTTTLLSNFTEFVYNQTSGTTPAFGQTYYTAASGSTRPVATVVGERVNGATRYVALVQPTEQRVVASPLVNAASLTRTGGGSVISLVDTGANLKYNPTVEPYSGTIIFAEYRDPITRTTSEKFVFVLEF